MMTNVESNDAVIGCLASAERPLRMFEIQERTGLPITTVSSVLNRLSNLRPPVVVNSATKRWTLAPSFDLGAAWTGVREAIDAALSLDDERVPTR
jgi:DNA-binding IclR family transcriptional regulator